MSVLRQILFGAMALVVLAFCATPSQFVANLDLSKLVYSHYGAMSYCFNLDMILASSFDDMEDRGEEIADLEALTLLIDGVSAMTGETLVDRNVGRSSFRFVADSDGFLSGLSRVFRPNIVIANLSLR